jgi:CheY-like chemotaxis protein
LHGKGTILLVEDEPRVRTATRVLLLGADYAVLEAADAGEALAAWETHRDEIDLIYTDMAMPDDLTGLRLAQRVSVDKPVVKVIITSKFITESLDLSKLREMSIIYLAKPCPPATLISVVQKCLQREDNPMD